MFRVHGYLDNKRIIDWRMEHLPRVGDTMRFEGERYGTVTEVIWCMDEPSNNWQRVNLRIESEPANVEFSGQAASPRGSVGTQGSTADPYHED